MADKEIKVSHDEMKKRIALSRKANDEKFEAHSKTTLKRHVETKFKTTMIGALSRFEKLFGEYWGHGLSDAELTQEQADNRDKWQLARTEILNSGNNQMRAALAEVDQNTIRYNKMEYNFVVTPKDTKGA